MSAEHWIVERIEGFMGKRIDACVIEADSETAAVESASGQDDRARERFYRVAGPLPSGVGMLPLGNEYRHGGGPSAVWTSRPSSPVSAEQIEDAVRSVARLLLKFSSG